MNTIIINILLAAIKNDKVQKAIGDFTAKIVTEKLLPLLPIVAAAAAKAVTDAIPQITGVADIAEITEDVRNKLNKAIPDIDFGIPALDDLLDFWRPKE